MSAFPDAGQFVDEPSGVRTGRAVGDVHGFVRQGTRRGHVSSGCKDREFLFRRQESHTDSTRSPVWITVMSSPARTIRDQTADLD